MRSQTLINAVTLALCFTVLACNNETKEESEKKAPAYKEENISYSTDGINMNGYVVYDSNRTEKRPGIIVIPEWWGLVDYAKLRAKKLAELGYIAMAIDLYGDGKTAESPDSAMKLAGPFYSNPDMGKTRFEAALERLKSYPETDASQLGAIGYCFGGAMVINMAKLGEPLQGVVSFHGNLNLLPPNKDLLKTKILVCHGEEDPLVPKDEVAQFKKQMDSVGADYKVKEYAGAVHAFTNPNATEVHEKYPNLPVMYNAAADSASWSDMKEFFDNIFKK